MNKDEFDKLLANAISITKPSDNSSAGMGLFEQLGVQPKEERKGKEKSQIVNEEKNKKEEFDKLISKVTSITDTKKTIKEEKQNRLDSSSLIADAISVTEPKKEKTVKKSAPNPQPVVEQQEEEVTLLSIAESFLTKKIEDIEEIKEEIREEKKIVEQDTTSLLEKSLGLLSEPSEVINADENFSSLEELQKHYREFLGRIQQQLSTLGGGGETRLEFLDDVDRDTAKVDGKYLQYQASTGKFIGADASGGGGGGSGITTANVRDAIQGYYGYTTDYYTVGVANTTQFVGAGETTMIMPQVAAVYQHMPTIMSGVNTNPYVGSGATIGTGQTEFSLAGLSSGASCIVRTALAFDPDEDNTNLDIQLRFTTNTATQGTGLTNFTILKENALIMQVGGEQQYISENLFSFFVGTTLEGTTQSDAGSFRIEVIPSNDGDLEVLAVTVNVVA